MRVRFLQDFQGVLTNEQFYTVGSIAEFDEAAARELIADGRAEAVTDDAADDTQNKRKR